MLETESGLLLPKPRDFGEQHVVRVIDDNVELGEMDMNEVDDIDAISERDLVALVSP